MTPRMENLIVGVVLWLLTFGLLALLWQVQP
jgi:hypothetical protein